MTASAGLSTRPLTRARPEGREDRVQFVMRRMRAGDWIKGRSGPELAAEWGVSIDAAKEYAAEAWRRVQAEVLDAPAIQVFAVERLKRIAKRQMRNAKGSDKPGLENRVAVQALDSLLKYADSGVLFPAGWDRLSAEEKWAAVDRAQAKVDAVRATLPPREAPQLEPGDGEGNSDS